MKQIIIDTYPLYGINETIKKLDLTENEKYFVQKQAKLLNLKRIGKYFTELEIKYLQDNYSILSIEEMAKHLNKSKEAVISRASNLGLKNDMFFYSDLDVQFIINNYNKLSIAEIAIKINKTESSIQNKIYKLGLTESRDWTDNEIEILEKVYPYYTNKVISEDFLVKRTSDSINIMGQKMGLKKSFYNDFKWYNKSKILDQLKIVAESIQRTPYQSELKTFGLPSENTYRRYFGSYTQECVNAGLIPNYAVFGKSIGMIASDGTKCASKSEYIVTEYLIKNNIIFIKEPHYKDYINDIRCKNKRADWAVGEYLIEFFGMPEKEYYKKRMEEKIEICKDNNIKLISLYKNDLNKLDEKLHILLQ